MLLLGEKDSLSSKDFMASLLRTMSTNPHCTATTPRHPRSFINTVPDQPVFSAHSSVKSYVSFHLANTRAFVRGLWRRGPAARPTPRGEIPGRWALGNAWHRCGVMQAGELRQRVLSTRRWRRLPAYTGPLRAEQQPREEQTMSRDKSG